MKNGDAVAVKAAGRGNGNGCAAGDEIESLAHARFVLRGVAECAELYGAEGHDEGLGGRHINLAGVSAIIALYNLAIYGWVSS